MKMKSILVKCSIGTAMACALSLSQAVPIDAWTLPNGARVLFVKSQAVPIVDVAVNFDAGSRRDPDKKSGLAAMTCGMLKKGVKGEGDGAGSLRLLGAAGGAAGVATGGATAVLAGAAALAGLPASAAGAVLPVDGGCHQGLYHSSLRCSGVSAGNSGLGSAMMTRLSSCRRRKAPA